jgi:hypothetical protein
MRFPNWSILRNGLRISVLFFTCFTWPGSYAEERRTDASPESKSKLFYTDYNAVSDPMKVSPPWQIEQEPAVEDRLQNDRIQIVPATATPDGPRKPSGPVMRVELRPDDVHTGGDGYKASRAEVYARHATPGSTPPAKWPDPVESTRWYGISVFVPEDFQTDRKLWFTFAQWKGYRTGSPPLSLEIKGDQFEAGGTRRYKLGRIETGKWTNFVVGVHLSPDPHIGWVNIYRNGVEVVSQTYQATMKARNVKGERMVDPIYFKQGIYRTRAWTAVHVLYFGPTSIGPSKESVSEYLA